MVDSVDRLRALADALAISDFHGWKGYVRDAADEITTLRAALEAQRPVVEAADKRQTAGDEWQDAWGSKPASADKVTWLENRWNKADFDLRLAVDAWRAVQPPRP